MSYQRLDFPGAPGQNEQDNRRAQSPYQDRPHQHQAPAPPVSPFVDPYYAQNEQLNVPQNQYQEHMSPSPMPDPRYQPPPSTSPGPQHPLQQSYHVDDDAYDDRRYEGHHQPLDIPMGPVPVPLQRLGTPGDQLQLQPTYEIQGIDNSYGHNEAYSEQHRYSPRPQPPPVPRYGPGEHAFDPEAHHDAYYNESYNPTPSDEYEQGDRGRYWQDDVDTRPILQTDDAYGPDPYSAPPPEAEGNQMNGRYMDAAGNPRPAPAPAPVRRWKTVKQVELFHGNLVLDCPVPPRLLNQVAHAEPPERDEYTHMRYTACTCDPAEFYNERYTLRQRLFAKPRHTELFIVITMYNEEEELFARTMMGVIKNIEYMNSRTSSKTWGHDAWKKIVVCVVSDGRANINPRTQAVLAAMGCYQEGIAKQDVNKKEVTAHIYEYSTQMNLEINKGIVNVKKGNTPIQMIFCLKEKNKKKINSHRWFFQAFGSVLDPNICVLIDAGTKPGRHSIYHLWKAFDINPMCAGACGEIKVMLEGGKALLNPLVASQNFEYKISNILDKPLESVFGFISVLPGAFSAYRYVALQNDKAGQGPLEKYFAGEKMHGAGAGVFTANMYLAEDRILCFELVAKKNCQWILQYVKSATGETDVPTEMHDFIGQRRRWLNGSFFAAVYALAHFNKIFGSGHSAGRKFAFLFEFCYQTISMLFSWFAIGNFFLVFKILTVSLGSSDLLGTTGKVLAVIFEWLYLVTLISCFVLALGNRPKGTKRFYMTMVVFWAVLMIYLMFAAIFITVKSIQAQLAPPNHFTLKMLFSNQLFFTLIVSMVSTYLLYLVMSILFLDPWHMVTSFVQYLLLTPTYVNILNVYAFCNTHDITWGTKGDDKAPKLASVQAGTDGKLNVAVPESQDDLNSVYEAELRKFASKYKKAPDVVKPEDKQADYYKGFRSAVVLVWMFCNLLLSAVVLNTGGLEVNVSDAAAQKKSTIYMSVVLWSVAGLSAFRWVGSLWFLALRLLRGE